MAITPLPWLLVFVLGAGAQTGRLPDDTEPVSYALRFALPADLGSRNATFAGRAEITILAKNAASSIALNAEGLVLRDVTVTDVDTNRTVPVTSWSHGGGGLVTIQMAGHVLADRRYAVRTRFEGPLRDDAVGFFKSYYATAADDGSGTKKWLAATKFQAAHARKAFPCYDEPAFRSRFKISIRRKRNEIALSNMPILSSVDVVEPVAEGLPDCQNWTWVHFEETPPIGVRSVAFFVGEFERLAADGGGGGGQRPAVDVYSHLGHMYQMEYAGRALADLLRAMEKCTGVAYGPVKLDLLALPALGGDAEHWGLNVHREKSIFVDKNTKSKSVVSAKTTAERVLARHWFGDLVTPVWWDFAWLDEGFATYFEYFATATVEPGWRLEHFFVVEQLQPALEYDQTTTGRRPLSASVNAAGDIDYVFDTIAGNKGAAVLRMLRNWVGEEAFAKALNIYLTRNRYTAVRPEQMWNAFDNALLNLTNSNLHGKNVHEIMNTWTERAGYPVVLVTRRDKSLVLTQKRFSTDPSNANDTTEWFVRLSYTTSKDRDFDAETAPFVWLDPSEKDENGTEVVIPAADDVEWYIFNVQSTGFFRVNYPEDDWLPLIGQLVDSPGAVHVLNRAQLIDDSFNLARAGLLNYTIPLSLTRYLEKEDDVIPWLSAMKSLNYVLDRMRRSEGGYSDVKNFVGKLAGTAFRMVNKLVARQKDEPRYPVNIGWNAFSTWACELDNDDCTNVTRNYFRGWLNGEEIPADIKDATFCDGVRRGEDHHWYRMLNLYATTKTYSEKESALRALACTENAQLLITYLEMIPRDECPIEKQDYKSFFVALSSRRSGIAALTYFLRNRFTDIVNNVGNGENMVTTIYSILASKVSTEHETRKISEMALTTKTPVEFRNKFLSIYNGETEQNQKWFDRNSIAIREFINPGSTVIPETTTPSADASAQNPSGTSGAPSPTTTCYGCFTILQITALSLSARLFVVDTD